MMSVERTISSVAFYDGNARTRCPASSKQFARNAVDSIISSLPSCAGWSMRLDAATPPYDEHAKIPAGHIEMTILTADGEKYVIGIVFGAEDEAGRMLRQPFDPEQWKSNPSYSWSSGLAAFNFDEAWRIVVLLAERLQVSRLEISYGLGM